MNWRHPALWAVLGALVTTAVLGALVTTAVPRGSFRPSPVPPPMAPSPDATQTSPAVPRPEHHAGQPPIPTRLPTFHWSQIESDDYRLYAANLRGIGCPDQTLRDILRADLAAVLAKPRPASTGPGEYWRAPDAEAGSPSDGPTAIDQALESLVGPETGPSPDLSFLPEAAAQAVKDWRQRFDALEAEAAEDAAAEAGAGTASDLARRRDRELATLLTPEQLEEYQLRHSQVAEELRSSLLGFEVEAGEFRQLVQARQAEYDAAEAGRFESADDAIRSILGESRFARYQQAQDPDFRDLFEAVRAAGHPYEDAVTLLSEIRAARAAPESASPVALDPIPTGDDLRTRLGPDLHLLFLERVAR